MRVIASPISGATVSTVIFASCFSGGIGIVSVTTSSSISLPQIFSTARSERMGCTQAAVALFAERLKVLEDALSSPLSRNLVVHLKLHVVVERGLSAHRAPLMSEHLCAVSL